MSVKQITVSVNNKVLLCREVCENTVDRSGPEAHH